MLTEVHWQLENGTDFELDRGVLEEKIDCPIIAWKKSVLHEEYIKWKEMRQLEGISSCPPDQRRHPKAVQRMLSIIAVNPPKWHRNTAKGGQTWLAAARGVYFQDPTRRSREWRQISRSGQRSGKGWFGRVYGRAVGKLTDEKRPGEGHTWNQQEIRCTVYTSAIAKMRTGDLNFRAPLD